MARTPKRQQKTERLECLNTGLGKVYIERRNGAPSLYARAHIQGGYKLHNTGKATLRDASAEAGRWFLDLYKQSQTTRLFSRPFSECAEAFLVYADDELKNEISAGQREQYHIKWKVLESHFDGVTIDDVDATFLRRLRDARLATIPKNKTTTVKPQTVKKDLVFVRLVLKYAKEHLKVINSLPEFPSFRGGTAVIDVPTPFLTLTEFNKLALAAEKLAKAPEDNPRVRQQRRELYAFIMIAVGACLRVDEAYSLRWMDCTETKLPNKQKQDAVLMMVESKKSRGQGVTRERLKAWGTYTAVKGYRLLKQWTPNREPKDKLFTERHADGLTKLLKDPAVDLHVSKHPDSRGVTRNARCFRHTGMSLLMEYSTDPDIATIADLSRTSPEMVQKWYDQNFGAQKAARVSTFRGDPKNI